MTTSDTSIQTLRAQARQDQGLCARCSRPQLSGYTLCPGHLVRARMNQWAVQRPECRQFRPGKGGAGRRASTEVDEFFALATQALEVLVKQDFKCAITGESIVLGENAQLDHICGIPDRPDLAYELSNLRWVSEKTNKKLNRGKANTRKATDELIADNLQRLLHRSDGWEPGNAELKALWKDIRERAENYLDRHSKLT